ncbi:uncharacterized protein RSE6_06514 [Rhynchosporium secalis]|uniref:Uncharacterized protein n=1 Tax=Rhynchosporium secalis TaxID=38038 RepID=A0A1E1MAH9_RHYSE|nr:uncharacterized protein RSE6_06514 [Rhynchosporium secalis]
MAMLPRHYKELHARIELKLENPKWPSAAEANWSQIQNTQTLRSSSEAV